MGKKFPGVHHSHLSKTPQVPRIPLLLPTNNLPPTLPNRHATQPPPVPPLPGLLRSTPNLIRGVGGAHPLVHAMLQDPPTHGDTPLARSPNLQGRPADPLQWRSRGALRADDPAQSVGPLGLVPSSRQTTRHRQEGRVQSCRIPHRRQEGSGHG